MVRLHSAPGSYPNLDVRLCGLLFLSTPHSGSAAADWNSYLVELAQNVGKTRARTVTTLLGSFNDESRKTKEHFGLISPAPPYVCLGETRATKIKGSTVMVRQTRAVLCNSTSSFPPPPLFFYYN